MTGAFTADGTVDLGFYYGGPGVLSAAGSFGAGEVTLEHKPEGLSTWIAVAGVSLTANGRADFDLDRGDLRAKLTGATDPDVAVNVGRRAIVWG